LALKFFNDHPIGTQFSNQTFGTWLENQGKLTVKSRDDAGWAKYCDQRYSWKEKINQASSHSRMREATGGSTFILHYVARDMLEVQSSEEALAKHDNIQPLKSHAATRKSYVDYLAQGLDFSTFKPAERNTVEMMFDAMIGLQGQLDLVHDQMAKLQRRMTSFIHELT
jgi:hypothetical protein